MSRLDELFAPFPITLKIAQVGELLGMDTQTVYRNLRAGRLPGYKVGTSWVVYRDELRDFLVSERHDRLAALGIAEPEQVPGHPGAVDRAARQRQDEHGAGPGDTGG